MRCAACGTEHDHSARFCGTCGAPTVRRCPSCDADVTPGVSFCTSCGAALDLGEERPSPPLEPIAERRRVSVVFVDLEGFTSLAESLDPEAVRAVQSRYFEAARSVIARFGGTVEKFIGDAVVAIWGAPVAHEDDPDRAVQAAFALVKAIRLLGGTAARHQLSGRASVATGEVAVNIGAVGQGIVAGDLLNVASRLQGQAPSGRVLVDEATRLLAHVATFEPVGELELKGRSAPVLAHVASPVAASPSPLLRGSHGGPFVGRDGELHELLDLQESVVRDGRSRLVSITGIAGIGKSRLAWELGDALDHRPELVAWHAGRAPAYGEGITFSAVADMVRHRIRAPAGTTPEILRRQLGGTLGELVRDDGERAWLEPRLMALLGDERLDAFDRDDLFAAWRRFFERVSETSPAVLVFEDLQWADPALLDFVEHLATWMRRHPILVVTVARPELLDMRPNWGAGVGRFTTMQLDRLPDAAMRSLLAQRVPDLEGDVVDHIVRHAGGVPLYAVEMARSLADTTRTPRERRSNRRIAEAQPETIAVPDSLQGLIAARIDALPAPERRLLLSAAVLGRRFPVEGLVAIGALSSTGRDSVSALVRREFLAAEDGGNEPASGELGFVQEVVRDAAYRTVSRQARRTLHLAAARWLEGKTDEDAAEALANHLSAVHDLAPDHPDAGRVARRAVSALRRAASTAVARRVPQQALGHIERALRLTDSTEQRAVVLDEAATVASAAGHLDLAERHLRELAEIQAAADHRRSAARTRARLASVLLTAQRNEPAVHELETAMRAIRSIERDAAGVELAAQLARARMLIGDDAGGMRWAKRGLAAAAHLDLDGIAADLRVTRGTARVRMGDRGGLDDLRHAIEEAQRLGAIGTELRARNNLAWLTVADDPRATVELARQAVALASERGVGDMAAQLAEVACAAAMDTGDWSWAIATIEELDHPGTPIANRINLAATAAILHALRGSDDASAVLAALEPLPDDLDGQITAGLQLATAWIAFLSGDLAAASRDADAAAAGLLGIEQVQAVILAARSRLWSNDPDGAEQSLAQSTTRDAGGRVPEAHVATIRAGITALADPAGGTEAYRGAARAWRELGLDGDLAVCLTDEARILGEGPDAETLALYERLGADGLRRLVEGSTAARR